MKRTTRSSTQEGQNVADLLAASDHQEDEEISIIEEDDKERVHTGFDEEQTTSKGKKRQLGEIDPISEFERAYFVKKVAPDIPYEYLIYVAFKNANFAPLPVAKVCGFIEEAFSYFCNREKSWHDAVVSTLNNHEAFIKCPNHSVALSAYVVNISKKRSIDRAIEDWKHDINEENVHMHGFNSIDEFHSVFDGAHGLYFYNPEAYSKLKNDIAPIAVEKKKMEVYMKKGPQLSKDDRLQYVKFNQPSIPYKFLTFIAFKNAHYAPLQLQKVCSFLETVFVYFSRNKTSWRNKVMASVYNNHTFLKQQGRTNSRFSYTVNPYKTNEIEDKVNGWRQVVNEENVYMYGFETMEEFDSVFNGEHSLFFENQEAYCRQSGIELPEKEASSSPAPPEDLIDDCIDSVLKKMSAPSTRNKVRPPMETSGKRIPLPDHGKVDDRFTLPTTSDPYHAVAVSAAQDVMFSRVHDGVQPVSGEDYEMFDFLDTADIARQVREYLLLTGFSMRSFSKDVLGGCPNMKPLLERPAHWDNLSMNVRTFFIQMKLFLEDVEQAVQESKDAVMQEEGRLVDSILSQVKEENLECQREPELELDFAPKEEPSSSNHLPSTSSYIAITSSNEENIVTFDGLSEIDGGVAEDPDDDDIWKHMKINGVGPSTSMPRSPQNLENQKEGMKFSEVIDLHQFKNVFEVNTSLPEDIHIVVALQKAGILPSQLYCKCASAMNLVGRSMPLWVCPSCTHLISVTENSYFKSPKVTLREIWIVLLAWIQDATVDFVISTFSIPKHVVYHYYNAFRRLCERISDKYPPFGGKGCTVHVDSYTMLNRVRVISGIDLANNKCFATCWGSSTDIPYGVRRFVKTGSNLLVTDREPNWASQFLHVQEINLSSPVTAVLQKVETTMYEMQAPPQDNVLRGYVAEVVVRYCEGTNLHAKMMATLREYVPDKLRVPHRLCPAGILLPENGNSKGMKVVYDPSRI